MSVQGATVLGNVKDDIKAANELRKSTMRDLYNRVSIVEGKPVYPNPLPEILTVVASRPFDKGFSGRDFEFFRKLYRDLQVRFTEEQHELASKIQDCMRKEGRYPNWMKFERDKRSFMARKCSAMIDLISQIESERVKTVQAAIQAKKEQERADHEAWLQKNRETVNARMKAIHEAEEAKRIAASKRPKLEGKVIGTSMESLAVLKPQEPKEPKKLKKDEVVELLGGEDNYKAALETAKAAGSNVLAEADGKKITMAKSGAVVKFYLHE